MGDETFAEYILGETDWSKKLEIMYYLKKRTGIYYDNSVIFKALITKMFLDYLKQYYPDLQIDENIVITARLLCDCMKVENSTNIEEIKNYAKRGAEYLAKLGFDERFCKICEGVNRYTILLRLELRLFITILKINNYLERRLNNESNSILYKCGCYTFRKTIRSHVLYYWIDFYVCCL